MSLSKNTLKHYLILYQIRLSSEQKIELIRIE